MDFLQMANSLPTNLRDIKYQKSSCNSNFFGAFQIILSNGVASPVFIARSDDGQALHSINIPDFSLVKRVNGSKQNGDNHLRYLIFNKKDGTQIAKVEMDAGKPYDTDFVIGDSEEIIGIYGYKKGSWFESLGFLVWTPPPL
jgi:hypothetical protein